MVVQQWPVEWLKDIGKKPTIPVPPVTNLDVGPSHTQQQDPPEDSEEQTESQQSESDQGGDNGNEEEEEDSVKTASDPNRQDKRKRPEPEEVNKPQSRKKAKALKDKNIDEEPSLTSEELDQALLKSTEVLTKKWSEFAATHLHAITSVEKHISELKDLAEESLTGVSASSAPVSAQPDLRQWPTRDNKGQVSSATLILEDAVSRSEMSMKVGIDYTKLSMTDLHLCQSAIMKQIQARYQYSQKQLENSISQQ